LRIEIIAISLLPLSLRFYCLCFCDLLFAMASNIYSSSYKYLHLLAMQRKHKETRMINRLASENTFDD